MSDRAESSAKRPAVRGRASTAGLLLVALSSAGMTCAKETPFLWVDDYTAALAEPSAYVIAPGDTLSVRVFNQEGVSGNVRVREDGNISLPFVNDFKAAGLEPPDLAKRLQAKLAGFFVNPVVTVALVEPAPVEVSVIGEVTTPGLYKLQPGAGILNALASASGLTPYADKKRIFVLRESQAGTAAGSTQRIRFTYESLSRAAGKAARFKLHRGDIVVVE